MAADKTALAMNAADAKILIIDDDRELGEMLAEFLAPDHLAVSACLSGEDGLKALRDGSYELLILDIMLPGMNGLDVLKEVRKSSDIPVIMLTARGDDVDRILGLEFGADDYLAKPFNPRELLARIKAIMRRTRSDARREDRHARVAVGMLEIDVRARRVDAGGQAIRLTGTEFELLRCLAAAPGEIVPKEQLAREVLGRRHMPYDRSIDTHISNVRRKLSDAGVDNPSIQQPARRRLPVAGRRARELSMRSLLLRIFRRVLVDHPDHHRRGCGDWPLLCRAHAHRAAELRSRRCRVRGERGVTRQRS